MKVLKIGAVWCAGCLVMRPRWQEIENELPWLETEYYEYDEKKEELEKMGIEPSRLPVFVFYGEDGKELTRIEGERSKKQIMEAIEKYRDE